MAKKKVTPPDAEPAATEYTVVARRYRPKQFSDLIGQEHVAAALVNALQAGRVAHAYLFTGARGVGKTSAARILAKALNCTKGPTATPCDECDSCKAVALGEDVDVSEIDGASNRGIDDARELRQNIAFRPTRSRHKIYIIDEVHMLTKDAFNALLKTLEEPPPQVKFIFATTEVNKIPITVLSRCQRFDFAHVGPAKIFEQLKRIVEREGFQADDDALKLIARRAGGSMRDSQSFLDQLLASSNGKITTEQVNAVLGTAGDERVAQLAAAILARDPKSALDLIAGWVESGLQIGELVDQMVGYWRSLMLVNCGGPDVRELPVSPSQKEAVILHSKHLSLDAILAGLDLWSAAKGRMRDSAHAQVLLEMVVIRLARMDELLSLGQLAAALSQGAGLTPRSAAPAEGGSGTHEVGEVSKKNGRAITESMNGGEGEERLDSTLALSESTVQEVWNRLNRYLNAKSPILAIHLKQASLPAIFAPNSLAIRFTSAYNDAYDACDSDGNIRKIEEALLKVTGQPVKIQVDLVTEAVPGTPARVVAVPQASARDRRKQLMGLPLFRKANETLGAQIWHVDDEFNPVPSQRPEPGPAPEGELDEN